MHHAAAGCSTVVAAGLLTECQWRANVAYGPGCSTCGVLGQLAARRAAPAQRASRLSHWELLVAQFGADYAATFPTLLPSPALKTWCATRFARFVAELRAFDERVNARLEQKHEGAAALSGLTAAAIDSAVQTEVTPQDGAPRVLQELLLRSEAAEGQPKIVILSASWSDTLISSALRQHFLSPKVSMPPIVANQLRMSQSRTSTAGDGAVMKSNGSIEWRIASAGDKATWLANWTATQAAATDAAEREDCGVRIVIGDSVGDLPAMTEAGCGIFVRESGSVRATAAAFGLQVRANTIQGSTCTRAK